MFFPMKSQKVIFGADSPCFGDVRNKWITSVLSHLMLVKLIFIRKLRPVFGISRCIKVNYLN